MKYLYTNRLLGKLLLAGIVISLFSLVGFIPEVPSSENGIINQNNISLIPKSHTTAPVSTNTFEYVYLTEIDNSNISKTASSSQNVIPIFTIFNVFQLQTLRADKYTYFSGNVLGKSLQQVCQLLDQPPPFSHVLA